MHLCETPDCVKTIQHAVGRRERPPLWRHRRALPDKNSSEHGETPRMPDGFKTGVDKDGWRN
jgi:hypothetical protein